MSQIYSCPSEDMLFNKNNQGSNSNLDFQLLIDYNNSSERNILSSTKNNILNNNKNNDINNFSNNNSNYLNDIKNENMLTVPEKCRRCRASPPQIMCKECYPFIYFCANCSNNLHSMESKKNHNIIPLDELNREIYNEINNNNNMNISNIYNNKNLTYNYFSNPDSLSSSINQINLNLSPPKYTTNYINDIKSIYETEKNNLIKKSFSL